MPTSSCLPAASPLHVARAGHAPLRRSAHQDDIEIMAHAGICDCLEANRARKPLAAWWSPTAPAPRALVQVLELHRRADAVGIRRDGATPRRRSSAATRSSSSSAHPSADVKSGGPRRGVARRPHTAIFAGACSPECRLSAQPGGQARHPRRRARRCLEALRALPPGARPRRVLGCEVWRDLDWLVDADKVALDSGRHPELAAQTLLKPSIPRSPEANATTSRRSGRRAATRDVPHLARNGPAWRA
jgi:hypothetical protein